MVAWLPFLRAPLSPDEAGFLYLARHWGPGSSLYGNFWVDRPPLLLWVFSLAAHFGPAGHSLAGPTAPAVKLIGALAAGSSVILAGLLAGVASRQDQWPLVAAAVTAATLLSSPLLGMPEVDGELVAVPFVLLGLTLLISSLRAPPGRYELALAAGAGAAAMSAFIVKQNVVDVYWFALVLLFSAGRRRTHAVATVGAFAGGSVAALGALLVAACGRGTSPTGLWDAVVTFRVRAAGLIDSSATAATGMRMHHLLDAFLLSGAALLLVVGVGAVLVAWEQRRRTSSRELRSIDLTWSVLALVAWELFGVVAGGSYWLHYLTGLVPGVVMLVALIPSGRGRVAIAACIAGALLSTGGAWAHKLTLSHHQSAETRVMAYLQDHAQTTDGVVVAFGHPEIVVGSGLSSPYPYLWSLPVRVRDPELRVLESVMGGPRAPGWIVVSGGSLDTWGIHAPLAQDFLQQHYREQVAFGDWHVWHRTEGES